MRGGDPSRKEERGKEGGVEVTASAGRTMKRVLGMLIDTRLRDSFDAWKNDAFEVLKHVNECTQSRCSLEQAGTQVGHDEAVPQEATRQGHGDDLHCLVPVRRDGEGDYPAEDVQSEGAAT